MNSKLIAVMVFVLLMVAIVPLMLRMGVGDKPDPVSIWEHQAGSGRSITVTVETNSQGTLSLHYHITIGDETVIDHAFFGTLPRTSPPPGFVTYTADGGGLLGIAQAQAPRQIIILHDFMSHESFPMRTVTYKDTDTRKSYPYYEDEDSIRCSGCNGSHGVSRDLVGPVCCDPSSAGAVRSSSPVTGARFWRALSVGAALESRSF